MEYEYRPDQTDRRLATLFVGATCFDGQGRPIVFCENHDHHRRACRLLFFLGEVDHHLHFARFDGAGEGDGPRIVG